MARQRRHHACLSIAPLREPHRSCSPSGLHSSHFTLHSLTRPCHRGPLLFRARQPAHQRLQSWPAYPRPDRQARWPPACPLFPVHRHPDAAGALHSPRPVRPRPLSQARRRRRPARRRPAPDLHLRQRQQLLHRHPRSRQRPSHAGLPPGHRHQCPDRRWIRRRPQ